VAVSGWRGGLAPQLLTMDNFFENGISILHSLSVRYARTQLNPSKYAYFDRLQGQLSKYAKLIILLTLILFKLHEIW